MNNEPVAWIKLDEVREHFESVGCGTVYKTGGEGRVPLYTHPVDAVNTSQEYVDKTQKNRHDEISSLIALTGQYKAMLAHPVKELTDEEIIEFIKSWEGLVVTKRTIEMIRAILRKAQEK